MTRRTQFIIRRGVLPWGLFAGAAAAFAVIRDVPQARSAGAGVDASSIVAVGAVCFVTWTVIVGWLVGGVRWALRESELASSDRRRPSSQNGNRGFTP